MELPQEVQALSTRKKGVVAVTIVKSGQRDDNVFSIALNFRNDIPAKYYKAEGDLLKGLVLHPRDHPGGYGGGVYTITKYAVGGRLNLHMNFSGYPDFNRGTEPKDVQFTIDGEGVIRLESVNIRHIQTRKVKTVNRGPKKKEEEVVLDNSVFSQLRTLIENANHLIEKVNKAKSMGKFTLLVDPDPASEIKSTMEVEGPIRLKYTPPPQQEVIFE